MNPVTPLTMTEAMQRLLQSTHVPGDLDLTMQHIVDVAVDLILADFGVIFPMNPITGKFLRRRKTAGVLVSDTKEHMKRPREDGFTREILMQGSIFVEDLEKKPAYQNNFTRVERVQSYVAIALKSERYEKPLGVIYLDFREKHQFSDHEKHVLHEFVNYASVILQNTWFLRRYRKVASIGKKINSGIGTVGTLFNELQKHMPSILDAGSGLLLADYRAESRTMNLHVMEDGEIHTFPEESLSGGSWWVIQNQKPLFYNHFSEEKGEESIELDEIVGMRSDEESLIYVPLTLREDVPLGVLSIQHPEPNVYEDEDLRLLQNLGNHVALALSNIRLFEGLRQLNEAGQFLARQIDSDQVLPDVVGHIKEITRADLVILYPYKKANQTFQLPPIVKGSLLEPDFPQPTYSRPEDLTHLAIRQRGPVFVKDSSTIYSQLGGNSNGRSGHFEERENIVSTAVVPLRVGDEPVGVLFVNFRHPQRFADPQKQLIGGLANHAAIAIRNAREFGTLRRRHLRELELLQDIDRKIGRNLNLQQLLQSILDLATEHIPVDEASILLYDIKNEALVTMAAIGRHKEHNLTQTISLRDHMGITRYVFKNKQPLRIDNVRTDPKWHDSYVELVDDIHSELAVPLIDGVEVIGVINFESTREAAFSGEDQDFLITLAGQAVLAVKNAQAYEAIQKGRDRLKVLNEVDKRIISQTASPDSVMRAIVENVLQLTDAEFADLDLVEDGRLGTTYRTNLDENGDPQPANLITGQAAINLPRGIVKHVAKTQTPYITLDDAQKDKYYAAERSDVHSEVTMPLLSEREELVGILNLESTKFHAFDDDDMEILQLLAGQAVIAINNARNYARFEVLNEVGQRLGEINNLEDIRVAFDLVVYGVAEHIHGEIVIRKYDESNQELVLVASHRRQYPPHKRMSLGQGANGWVALHPQTIVVDDISNPPHGIDPQPSDPNTRSLLISPIQFKGQYYGNLSVTNTRTHAFAEADVKLIKGLVHQLAITIHRLEASAAYQLAEKRANAAEVMGSVGQSAFELAHRLGNELGLVRTYNNEIRDELETLGVDSSSVFEGLDSIVSDVGRVLTLSKELKSNLASLREDEGKIHDRIPLPVATFLREATKSYPAQPSNISVSVDVASDVAQVLAAPEQFADILRNLYSNAIEVMPEGGTITLRARNTGKDIEIQVEDTGPGIPLKRQPRIFDLFYSTKGGFGFGLWSAKRNALTNGGDLRVESATGQGTVFTLLLPTVTSQTEGGDGE